jgi:uncharacterized membrane protein YukC
MILSIDNPIYNTLVVFFIIMILVYVWKPNIMYDNKNKKFREFGMTEGKTLIPIHIFGIILAICLYTIFYLISSKTQKTQKTQRNYHNENINDKNINDLHDLDKHQMYNLLQYVLSQSSQNNQVVSSHTPSFTLLNIPNHILQ